MVETTVIEKVRMYTQILCNRFPVKKVMLFGSFAKGTPAPDSDIDVAVVLKEEPEDILDTEKELFKLRRSVDVRIEPKLVDDIHDLSGFWQEISKYGLVIYSA